MAIDGARCATRQDVAGALVSLAILPKRVAIDPELEFASYLIAVEGVPAAALSAAVQAILRNALGHTFFPSPPELRGQVDRIWEAHRETVQREARRRRIIEDMAELRRPINRTPDEIERVRRRHEAFHAALRGTSAQDELAAIVARYDPAALATVPDRPMPEDRR